MNSILCLKKMCIRDRQYSTLYPDCPPERYRSVLSLPDWFPYNASKTSCSNLSLPFRQRKRRKPYFMTHALLRSQYSIFISYCQISYWQSLYINQFLEKMCIRDSIYNYGIIRCKKSEFNTVSPDDYVCCRETNLSVECLIHDKVAAKKRYKNLIIDNASIEDIMLFYIKGGVK